MDLEALLELSRSLPKFELTHLPSLHAKVYVADESMAVVTSANLTEPGITGNLEYGVAFTDGKLVREIRRDFENYSLLGAKILPSDIESLAHETADLKQAFKEAEQSIRAQARRAFKEKLDAAHLSQLVELHPTGVRTLAKALPEGSPFGRSQTLKGDHLRQPANRGEKFAFESGYWTPLLLHSDNNIQASLWHPAGVPRHRLQSQRFHLFN